MKVNTRLFLDPISEAHIRLALPELLLKTKNKQPEGKYNGADVYYLGNSGIGYIVLVHLEQIIYFVRYRKVRHNNLPLGRQVLLWRDRAEASAEGFAKYVFFKILMPKYKALISDTQQTSLDQGFWSTAIGYALRHDYYVYYLNRYSSPNQLIGIPDLSTLDEYKKDIWGNSNKHKYTFAVISSIPLELIN